MTRREASRFRRHMDIVLAAQNDAAALEVIDLFPAWQSGRAYTAGERIRHGEALYKCVQGHTAQEDWTPDLTPALWTAVSIDEWPEWVQPTGAQDAYMTGDKVSHNGSHWVCVVDNCTWEPGIYGWEVTDE